MDDNLVMSNYLVESLGNNISFLKGEEDNIDTLNKSFGISILNIDGDKMGSLGIISESSGSVQKRSLENSYSEVGTEAKRNDELEQFNIIENSVIKAVVRNKIKDESKKAKQGQTTECEFSCSGKTCEKNITDIGCSLHQKKEVDSFLSLEDEIPISSSENKSDEKNRVKLYCKTCKETFSSDSAFDDHMKIHRKEKTYNCKHCNKSFKQLIHKRKHEQSHIEQSSFQCEVCLETLRSRGSLNSHMKKHFGVKDHFCESCSASFYSKYELKIHMIKHTGEVPHRCKECGDEFATVPRLKRHEMIHTGERPFQCEVCGVVFREKFTLNAHKESHLPRGPYPCTICGEEFSRLNGLTLHKRVHNTDNTYSYIPQKCGRKKDTLGDCKPPGQSTLPGEESVLSESLKVHESNFPALNEVSSGNRIPGSSSIETNIKTDQDFQSYLLDAVVQAKINHEKGLPEDGETSSPHPDVVREAISTGTLLESQADDGKGYLIVLPKTFIEKNYTLFTVCPPAINSKVSETADNLILKEDNEVLHNNCNLFSYDCSLDSVTEVACQSQEDVASEESQNKTKKSKRLKGLTTVNEDSPVQSESQPKKLDRSPARKKMKKKKKPITNRLYNCQLCGKDYTTSSNLKIHIRTHTGERPYYCDYCGLGFKQMPHLRSHVRIHTGETPYQCSLCGEAFNQSSRLNYHIRNIHIMGKVKRPKIDKQCSVRNFYCKVCDKTFLNSCYKTDHMKTHADDTIYQCEKCDATFKGKPSFKKHMSCHADDKWSICEVCGLQYKDHNALNLHKNEAHGIFEDTKDIISVQSKTMLESSGNNDISNENLQQSNVEPLSLSEDGLKQESLKGISNGNCVVDCSKEETLKVKILDNGKYQCYVCRKTFNTRSNAHVHLRMHSDLRPYKCNDCKRAFRQISHLKDHVKMHTGEKPFKCSVCPATFAQSSGVKVHIKRYHRGKASIINEQKDKKDLNQVSIIFENVPQIQDDTVVINIENGHSVSVEHKRDLNKQECDMDVEERCKICDKVFSSHYMKNHMRTHKKLSYKCFVCKKFHKKYELYPYFKDKESHYVCSKCKCIDDCSDDDVCHFPQEQPRHSDDRKSQELETETNVKVPKCKYNLTNLGSVESSENLVKVNEKATKNVCEVCSKSFKRKSALKFHKQLSHIGIGDIKIRKVSNRISAEKLDTISERINSKCNINHDRRSCLSKGENHLNESDEVDYHFKCNFCGDEIQSLLELKDHIKRLHHRQEELVTDLKESLDTVCGHDKIIDNQEELDRKTNRVLETTEKVKNELPVSEKHFTIIKKTVNSFNLKNKDLTAKGAPSPFQSLADVKSYQCLNCKKSYSRASKLRDHVKRWCKVKSVV